MIALFGGTFDPIHLGHINMASQCMAELCLDTLHFLPCAVPVHKAQPGITDDHRLAMLSLAIDDNPGFKIDHRELNRQGPSYSQLTLQECRAEYPNTPLIFLMGMDSFNSLPSWYKWQEIIRLCHIVVYQRPGEIQSTAPELADYLAQSHTLDKHALHHQSAGLCYFLSGKKLDAASSEIRKRIKNRENTEHLLDEKVRNYVNEHHLYAE
ncbi:MULTISPECIES: nicotinate-nucleotide adenylyltransferase [Pseudoalteromonas]|uniref:Probable nicotinate-nucleotide adenylyltransferase n=1 Tax=Pseudoalteromonas amylolytica TaxID=1859457 RepID=A0A1S1MP41_9GAMM|nr:MULTISPECIES: nicotinate-nucleotide adenylyltransferase [Pseudoalteromonas]OHU85726.1 nicotinate (nicotinamide) nucleotide adenylyltransferase [Pseudoalteromonas sp. JW3]OHU87372.1 nicotinate (nicotinamide) nucleotide adenylyltransferase [Pseudoalteromonas amylolytica]